MAKLAVIIPAAGSGSRMGSRLPKPFIELGGVPILERTIRAFLPLEELSQLIISTTREWMPEVKGILEKISSERVELDVVEGGSERQYSIMNAMAVLGDDIELVAVHDAVRPFISSDLVRDCCTKARELGGAIIAVPAKDTIKELGENHLILNTPDRSRLWQAQTPQIFKKNVFIDMYTSAKEVGFVGTDDASLAERRGVKVGVVEGDRRNLKITYPIDLKIAELILSEGEG